MKLILALITLLASTVVQAQMVNPHPNYAFQNMLGVGRNTSNDANTYLMIGPNGGANKGVLLPRVTDTASITGVKRQGLLIYSHQLQGFAYYDSLSSRWAKIGVGGGSGGGGGISSTGIITTSANTYTVNATDQVILVNAADGVKYVNFPAVGASKGREIIVKKTDSSLWNIFIDPAGSETVESQPTYRICRQWRYAHFVSDGVQWLVIAK